MGDKEGVVEEEGTVEDTGYDCEVLGVFWWQDKGAEEDRREYGPEYVVRIKT